MRNGRRLLPAGGARGRAGPRTIAAAPGLGGLRHPNPGTQHPAPAPPTRSRPPRPPGRGGGQSAEDTSGRTPMLSVTRRNRHEQPGLQTAHAAFFHPSCHALTPNHVNIAQRPPRSQGLLHAQQSSLQKCSRTVPGTGNLPFVHFLDGVHVKLLPEKAPHSQTLLPVCPVRSHVNFWRYPHSQLPSPSFRSHANDSDAADTRGLPCLQFLSSVSQSLPAAWGGT